MAKSSSILYCHCAYSQIISADVKRQVLKAITGAGLKFETVPDLCEMAARHDPALKRWAGSEAIKIIACFPRAVKWLFHAGGAPLPQENVEILNMRADSVQEIVSSLLGNEEPAEPQKDIQLEKTGDWVPWFPVIDYDRCENCKQCLNFCLFGVYELSDEEKVQVSNPANCKTNCPACARICPQTAIIFPKYSDSPINGDEVGEEYAQDEKTKVGIGELLKGDIHEIIRQRSKARKRFEKDTNQQQELSTRQKVLNLAKLQEKLDIPPEVLASLSGERMSQGGQTTSEDCPNARLCQGDCKAKGESTDGE